MHTLGMRHQKMQQAEFGRAKLDRRAIARHAVGDRIEGQAANIHQLIGHLRCPTAQHSFDPRIQFARRKWLSDIVISAGFQPFYFILFLAARSEHDHGYGFGEAIGFELTREINTAHAG